MNMIKYITVYNSNYSHNRYNIYKIIHNIYNIYTYTYIKYNI